ncbi:DUF6059 family protein [Kitasatospora sp. NPDC096128]|uniref:DUF6059 family protein n=1 Tax=Kitasatospora sp. NPDC096128 TaxID=3155547 RepID=UPI00332C572F
MWWLIGRLAAVGTTWFATAWWPAPHRGPLGAHPERLRPELPLTATERALRKELPRRLRRAPDPLV